jgi:hypothetical protein
MTNADQERAKSIVQYLIARLRRCYPENISKNEFARLLYPEIAAPGTRNSRVKSLLNSPSLTTADLTDLILRINQHCGQMSHSQMLTPEEMLALFQRLVQLKPEEKQQLGFQTGVEEVLLQQALLNVRLYQNPQDYGTVLNLYCTSMSLTEASDSSMERSVEEIYDRIPGILMSRMNYLPEAARDEVVREVESKVRREIRKILLKSGTQHSQFWNARNHTAYVKRYLTDGFIDRLTQAIGENYLLMRDFPIYIRKITVEDLGTLPLSATSTTAFGLFNTDLLVLDRQQTDLADLASQSAIGVTVHFSLRKQEGTQIDFALTSSGIGGTLSQIVKVINMALLSDIACLQDREHQHDFFPIAHDVMVNQTIIQNSISSPVWAHSLVMLCQSSVLAQAMSKSSHRGERGEFCFYNEVAFGDSIGRGDYCDFDFLQTVAKAALYARLRAIKHTGINPNTYLNDLRQRIERTRLLQEARAYVTSYPFSSLAQEGWLRGEMLSTYWDNQEKVVPLSAPQAVFETYLLIAETFLQEGMYRRAHGYLRRLKRLGRLADQAASWYASFSTPPTTSSRPLSFENFSGSLLVRYQLCWATYYYLLDRSSERTSRQAERPGRSYFGELSQEADQRSIIHKAWNLVNKAEELVAVRLAKYLTINEVSQGIFHPHYQLLAQIYFLRLRLLLFFPRLVPMDSPYLPTDAQCRLDRRDVSAIYGGWLYLLEKARLYAACDGDQGPYASYTGYQSCIYVIASYIDQGLSIVRDDRETHVSPQDCMQWARQLRNHALLSYAKTGRHCYYQIKEKSGVSKSLNRSYGKYSLEEIPPIREMSKQDNERPGQHTDGILYIDMELLSIPREFCQSMGDMGDPKEKIYLFGSNACYLLFARGLYHLCSNDRKEFEVSGSPQTLQEWDEKFACAYRLFTHAWAMADDGGTWEPIEGEDDALRMRRNFIVSESVDVGTEAYLSAHVQSVRDLYPYRVTEIVDLAKIFMAASALLRMYVSNEEEEQLRSDVSGPLSSLHQEQDFSDLTSSLLKEQSRYNGHLEQFFKRCERVLLTDESQRVQPLTDSNCSTIVGHRKRILEKIFTGLYQEN